jgi:hypothetical protein
MFDFEADGVRAAMQALLAQNADLKLCFPFGTVLSDKPE